MKQLSWRTVAAAAFAVVISAAALAQQPPTRIRGTIEKADGNTLQIKARDGSNMTVKLADNARVMAFVRATMADIKPNSYIGVTAMPQADGGQRAIAVHIFTEAQRGVAEGHRPWDLRPGSTMTNAAVDNIVTGTDGETITVKYEGGEKKVIVPKDATIVAYTPGDKSELKAGVPIIIFAAAKQADGTFTAPAISVGRGIAPPM